MKKFLIWAFVALFSVPIYPYHLSYKEKPISLQKTKIFLSVTLEPNEVVYEQEIICSIDNPAITVSEWTSSEKRAVSFDGIFKEQRRVFDEPFTIECIVEKDKEDMEIQEATLHIMMASNQHTVPQELLFPVHFASSDSSFKQEAETTEQTTFSQDESTISEQTWTEWTQTLKQKLNSADSYFLQLLFAFLLGILLSMTPCIYPMIPITVGILQSQGSKSLLRNFLLSLCYAGGLGTTFALMGLLAASSGQAFGYLMGNPVFVIFIIIILCYFAFSLFGFYNLYIPRFLQNKGNVTSSGSAISIFLFGLASGTFASPCLSPGLALILALVATMAHKLLGLLLLFAFGIGLSIPLIIIGTFSSSLALLPRAGMWMLEVQKIFGFLLLSMCFYYLSVITPWHFILIGLSIFFFIIGIYYLRKVPTSLFLRLLKNGIGSFFVILSIFMSIQALQEAFFSDKTNLAQIEWQKDFDKAIATAQNENKIVLIDFSTPYCSICSAITKTVLQDPAIAKLLSISYILLAIDASDTTKEPYKTLRTTYDIQGVPTLIIIDPTTREEKKRWMSELYGMKKSTVIAELNKYKNNN